MLSILSNLIVVFENLSVELKTDKMNLQAELGRLEV
jgi:hypothetical protein